jgi:hypothetical protein
MTADAIANGRWRDWGDFCYYRSIVGRSSAIVSLSITAWRQRK